MILIRFYLLLTTVTLLQACTIAPSKPISSNSQLLQQEHLQNLAQIKQFSLKGRIGIQSEGKGFSGGINWQHETKQDEISLYSPLGGELLHINNTADKASLSDAQGNKITADDVETLAAKVLGVQLPLNGLSDWALGRPINSDILESTWDSQGRLIKIVQDGWLIEYQNYLPNNHISLPQKITLRNDKIFVKIQVDEWKISQI
jgi:outer membrane lipoprotein LolB